MSVSNERYYVRFKGRVLGPLDHEKTTELIRRGQITRQHELSLDGTQWASASEFPRLFNSDKSVGAFAESAGASESKSSASQARELSDVWYANIDDQNEGPVTEEVLENWAASKKLKPDMLVWKAGMADWQAAQSIRPEWFQAKSSPVIAASVQESSGDTKAIADRMLGSLGWIQFLSITGLVMGVLSLVATTLFFLGVATSGGSGPVKVASLLFSFCQILSAVIWFLGAFLLFRYSSRLSVLKYRHESADLIAAANAGNLFWKFTGIVVLVWLVLVSTMMLAIYLLGLSIPLLSNEDEISVPIDPPAATTTP